MKYILRRARKLFVLAITCFFIVTAIWPINALGEDISGHWAADSINSLVSKGIVRGDGSGNINPDSDITRAEFVAVINRAMGYTEKAASNFPDVLPGTWHYDDFAIARNEAYMLGDDSGNANPDKPITRAEAAVIFSRILEFEPTLSTSTFDDSASFPDWSIGSIIAMAENNLVKGYPDNTFRALNHITRAEAFTILDRVRAENRDESDIEEGETPLAPPGGDYFGDYFGGSPSGDVGEDTDDGDGDDIDEGDSGGIDEGDDGGIDEGDGGGIDKDTDEDDGDDADEGDGEGADEGDGGDETCFTVTGVTVEPAGPVEVHAGYDLQFSVSVTGAGKVPQGVTWEVIGNCAVGTAIDHDGLLVVAADEVEPMLIVRATPLSDPTIFVDVTVNIKQPVDAPAGSGVELDPYLIQTPLQMAWMAEKVNAGSNDTISGDGKFADKHWKLADDVDLSAYGADWNGGKGWAPIGNEPNPFRGVFDGNNKKIAGLYINDPALDYAGLFGCVSDIGATIQFLDLVGADIHARDYVGGVAGHVDRGTIEGCSFTGAVAGSENVGGVTGAVANGSVVGCYASGLVNGDTSVGGIVGNAACPSSVSVCFAACSVRGIDEVGGLCGTFSCGSNMMDCYTTGDVSGQNNVGGVVGAAGPAFDNATSSSIMNCYATGNVSGQSNVGGIAGMLVFGGIENCAALNQSVAGYLNAGRVVGMHDESNGALLENVAFSGMTTNGGAPFVAGDRDGMDISSGAIMADGTMGGRFAGGPWTSLNGKLPILAGLDGQDGTAPQHILGDVYFTDLPKQLAPKNLLVLVMNYNNGGYDAPDEEVEAYWSDLIFGEGGSFEDGEASVNDFFKDMSGGKFWWDPILLGDNTTGVYSFHFDKDYDWENTGQHPEWPIYEFTYDTMITLESLAQKGLDMSQFALDGMNNENYPYLFGYLWDGPQSARNPQWYTTSNIMCIFPPYNFAGNEYIPLSSAADSFAISVHLNMNSSFGVVAHELAHCLGAVDVYRWGYYSSDLMSYAMNSMPAPYYVSHINPFYKIIWGWVKPRVVTESCQITLYPPTSDKYEPVIVRTSDPDQYYILENRQSEKFDFGLEELFGTLIPRSDGLNIWRIDKLGCEAIYNRDRKGISLEVVLRYVNYRCQLWSYTDSERIENISEGATDIIITYVYKNPDGSVVVDIDFNG